MTISDIDISEIKQKTLFLIDKVFIDESFPYQSAEHIIDDQYVLKIFAELEQGDEHKASIRFALKIRE